jgi:ATP-dependent DNA ligase
MVAIAPMEALLAADVPEGERWLYEPKWDGFRCIATRDGDAIELWSKSGKSLSRYFPEVVAMLAQLKTPQFVVDGELMVIAAGAVSFDALQLRLHPADSRVRKLSVDTPATFMAFDCLALGKVELADQPLEVRRASLKKFVERENEPTLILSPATKDRKVALDWLNRSGGALDGIMAKERDAPYRSGERAMVKVKQRRTADCVVGGFRYGAKGGEVGSLLLGVYDDAGLLNHVGYTSSISAKDRPAWTAEVESLIEAPGFTGNSPGGPSRWATERSSKWEPLKPVLVVEVLYDQVTAGRFRHGTKLLRRRPDKSPKQCTASQLAPPLTPAQLEQLLGRTGR